MRAALDASSLPLYESPLKRPSLSQHLDPEMSRDRLVDPHGWHFIAAITRQLL